MNSTVSLCRYLTHDDFEALKIIAWYEHLDFFKRNPHLKSAFNDLLIGICVYHHVKPGSTNSSIGIEVFDIWHFYEENKNMNFPYRTHKLVENGYKGKQIDFLKRAVPQYICRLSPHQPGQIILNYIQFHSEDKIKLLEKGIIGLWPQGIFGIYIKKEAKSSQSRF